MTRPSIDHSTLSPSGHVSKRSREAARKRAIETFWPDGFPQRQPVPQPSARERLLRQAGELEGLANRGMKPRAYKRKAAELRKEAEA